MKGCTEHIPQLEPELAYKQLLLAIIQTKIKRKVGKVVIVNLENNNKFSSSQDVCPKHLQSFCETSCGAEVCIL